MIDSNLPVAIPVTHIGIDNRESNNSNITIAQIASENDILNTEQIIDDALEYNENDENNDEDNIQRNNINVYNRQISDKNKIPIILKIRNNLNNFFYTSLILNIIHLILNPINIIYICNILLNYFAIKIIYREILKICIFSNIVNIIFSILSDAIFCFYSYHITDYLIDKIITGYSILFLYYVFLIIILFLSIVLNIYFIHNYIKIILIYGKLTSHQKIFLYNKLRI